MGKDMRDDGGAAFPSVQRRVGPDVIENTELWTHGGMSLRDYFAAHCPLSYGYVYDVLIANGEKPDAGKGGFPKEKIMEAMTAMRYAYADAMLKERSKT